MDLIALLWALGTLAACMIVAGLAVLSVRLRRVRHVKRYKIGLRDGKIFHIESPDGHWVSADDLEILQ